MSATSGWSSSIVGFQRCLSCGKSSSSLYTFFNKLINSGDSTLSTSKYDRQTISTTVNTQLPSPCSKTMSTNGTKTIFHHQPNSSPQTFTRCEGFALELFLLCSVNKVTVVGTGRHQLEMLSLRHNAPYAPPSTSRKDKEQK